MPRLRPTRLVVWAAAGVLALAGGLRVTLQPADARSAAAAGPPAGYAGIFADEEIEVELIASTSGAPDAWTGSIRQRDQRYPLTARVEQGTLRGTFTSGRDRFTFTGSLTETGMVLTTDGTNYRLTRRGANPLARPNRGDPADPLVQEHRPPLAPAQPVDRSEGPDSAKVVRQARTLHFRVHSVKDEPQMIGGEAYSLLVPVGWKVDGGVSWRLHPTMPAALAIRVYNPRGAEALQTFPTLAFSWSDASGPTGLLQIGANYLGNEVRPPPQDSLQCLKEIVIPRCRSQLRWWISREQELPKLADAIKAANPDQGGLSASVHAGKVRIEYEEGGRTIEEDFYGALLSTRVPAGNLTIWLADRLTAMKAEKGQLDERSGVLQTMVNSLKVNLDWFNRQGQLLQALAQPNLPPIRSVLQFGRIISQTRSEIRDSARRSYEERQTEEARIRQGFRPYVRGVEEYMDPRQDRPVELPAGYRRVWASPQGEYLLTDDVSFDPNELFEADWRRLDK